MLEVFCNENYIALHALFSDNVVDVFSGGHIIEISPHNNLSCDQQFISVREFTKLRSWESKSSPK